MATEFCPRCGTPRTGAFRFCRSCQFDFDAAPAAQPAPAVSPAPQPDPIAQTGEQPAVFILPPERQQLAQTAKSIQTLNIVTSIGGLLGAGIGFLLGAYVSFGSTILGDNALVQIVLPLVLMVVFAIIGQRLALSLLAR